VEFTFYNNPSMLNLPNTEMTTHEFPVLKVIKKGSAPTSLTNPTSPIPILDKFATNFD